MLTVLFMPFGLSIPKDIYIIWLSNLLIFSAPTDGYLKKYINRACVQQVKYLHFYLMLIESKIILTFER